MYKCGFQLSIPNNHKNIAAIGIGQWTKRLEITTNDGKTLRYAFLSSAKTRRCHDAIVARM